MAGYNKPFAVQGMNVVSPKGKALWCKVTEPDRKFNAAGVLSTQLVLDPTQPDVKAFVDRLESLQSKAFEEAKETLGAKGASVKLRPLFVDHVDQNGNPTGDIVFKFTLKDVDTRAASGKASTIQVVGADKRPVTPVPLVGNDSIVRIAAFVFPYYMAMSKEIGLTLMWTKMQIIELNEYGGGSGDDFEEEEGFAVTATATVADVDDF